MDWKSGGDTNFAPIATADGKLDCRGFWNDGDERPDKDAVFTSNAQQCPTIATYVESVGANFGRVRTIKLEPQDHDTAMRSFHRDDNNRFNPPTDGWVVRELVRAHRQPGFLHAPHGMRGRRDPRPRDRDPRAAAPRRAVRGRHAAPVARRGPQRHRAAVRAHHQLRERTRTSTAGSTHRFADRGRRASERTQRARSRRHDHASL